MRNENWYFFAAMLCLGLGLAACKREAAKKPVGEPAEVKKFVNVTILLDLSNRIKEPLQAEKDLKIVAAALEAFAEQVRRNHFIFSRDRLCVQVAPQAGTDTVVSSNGDALVMDVGSLVKARKQIRTELPVLRANLMESVKEIYERAKSAPMQGADIWTYVRNQSGDLIRKPENPKDAVKNKLIIITNGYLDFDKEIASRRERGSFMDYGAISQLRNNPQWESQFESRKLGLKAHSGLDLENLEVAVLEVHPADPAVNTNEFEIIRKYWTSWFKEMGVKCDVHESKQSGELSREIVDRFLAG